MQEAEESRGRAEHELVQRGMAVMGAPGFDDAPVVTVPAGRPKIVTLVYPYYENPEFLRFQLDLWENIPMDVARNIRAVIVDDGSPLNTAEKVLRGRPHFPFPIQLFRIEVDVRWNWLAARNIAMHHAPTGWTLLTDMDHVARLDLLQHLINDDHDDRCIYRLSRREHGGTAIHPHPNTMFMTKSTFWRVGGYDEELSGHYGTDGDWRRRCAKTAVVYTLAQEIIRFEFVKDSSTTRYLRKQPQDAGKKAIIARRKHGWKPRVLSFPYHEVNL